MIRIGFLDRSDPSWTAGASYSRSMVHALASAADERCEICVVSGTRSSLAALPPGVRTICAETPDLAPAQVRQIVKDERIDVLLPVTEALLPDTDCALIGWIPDFQHRHLQKYFTEAQRAQRDRHFGYLIGNCDAMMFSSEAVRADFRVFYPGFSGPSDAVHFCSSFASDAGLIKGDPGAVRQKYNLPEAFALVANQFWKHKNHRLVVEAVAQARKINPKVHVVMVGMLSDSRDVANPHLSEIVRRLTTEKLFENISVLGEVPFSDLVAILRSATEIIQPSEFEGWNTTVQDALALGKSVACSDIATHREQAPAAFFFPPDDASPLAAHLAAQDWSGGGWLGEAVEQTSLQAERERGRQWASGLIDFCVLVSAEFRTKGRARSKWVDPIDELKTNPLTYIDYLESQNRRLTQNEARLRTREEEAARKLQETREKAAESRRGLEERLRAAKEETQGALEKFYREKAKPLRMRVVEELRRVAGLPSKR